MSEETWNLGEYTATIIGAAKASVDLSDTNHWAYQQLPQRLLFVQFVNGRIEMVYRQTSMSSNNWGPTPDRVWKEIYEARDGKIVLAKTVKGEIVPSVGESVLFEDGDSRSI